MSRALINRSNDLKKLQDRGFALQVTGAFLLVHDVPYVNVKKEIAIGTLVSKLDLAGDQTARPESHVAHFQGQHPCNIDGSPISGIQNASQDQDLGDGVKINHTFSAKPEGGQYTNYYHKVTTYVQIISSPAEAIDPSVTAKTFRVIEADDAENIFHYLDTNSSRAEIGAISSKLDNLKIAIIGLGGTGSYVLDFVSKTRVKAIHVFDCDTFLQHNAFRAPGAASIEELREQQKKVSYFHGIYSKMRKGIIPHPINLNSSNLQEISEVDFVFICIDNGESRKAIIDSLRTAGTPFIDVGIGVQAVDNSLMGSLRTTTGSPNKLDHITARISFSESGEDDYSQNVQISELNALNAALAVIKWKKLFGFYHDQEREHNTIYDISTNKLLNDEIVA
jgi:hypothetical protein